MSLQIGRCGTDFTFRNPSAYQVSARDYEFSGWINAGSVTLAQIARDQLNGLTDGDEPVVPVVASWDTSLSGWYRINGVSVDARPGFFDRGVFEWSVSATRVGSGTACRVESFVNGASRTTAHSVTDVDWHAVPSSAEGYPSKWVAYTARTGPGGTVQFYRSEFYGNAGTYQWYITPSGYYSAGCTIKVDDYLVVGKNNQNFASSWEISNGLLKVGPGSTGTIAVTAPGSTPGSWGTAKEYDLGYFSGSFQSFAASTVQFVRVLKNEPQECVLRLVLATTTASNRPTYLNVDIQLKRGDRLARVTMTSPSSLAWGIKTDASTAGTAISDGGYVETADDGDGNRGMVVSSTAFTTSLGGPSMLYLTSAGTVIDLGVGVEYGGTGSADPERETDLRDQYFAVMAEQQRIVAY